MASTKGKTEIPEKDLVCRTCLNESQEIKSIFTNKGPNLSKMLQLCSGLNIHAEDGFSANICSGCLKKLYIAYDFRQQCEISYNTFVHFVSDHPDETYESKLDDPNVILIINGGSACRVLMDTVCRACLNESSNMKLIFKDEGDGIRKMLECCTGLNILAKDGFPNKICPDCLNKVHISYEFRRQCEILSNFLEIKMIENKLANDFEMDNMSSMVLNMESVDDKCIISEPNESATDFKGTDDCVTVEKHEQVKQLVKEVEDDTDVTMLTYSDNSIITHTEDISFGSKSLQEVGKTDLINNQKRLSLNLSTQNTFKNRRRRNRQDTDSSVPKTEICEICQKAFVARKSLLIHKAIKHKQREEINHKKPGRPKTEICNYCQKAFVEPRHLQIHMTAKHKDRGSPITVQPKSGEELCTICQKVFASHKSLLIHQGHKHSAEDEPTTCTHCNQTFEKKVLYYSHMKTQHNIDDAYSCEECAAKFSKLVYLRRHQAGHLEKKAYRCTQCDIIFYRRDSRNKQIKRTYSKCDSCDRS